MITKKAKKKRAYQCQSCGYISPKWLGNCPDCGAWNSFVEEEVEQRKSTTARAEPQLLSEVTPISGKRYGTGIKEYDRVLGGGVVSGSVVLIGGDPGIGKSTLMLQTMSGLSQLDTVLYVSGEESPEQIKIRADRLSISSDKIMLLPETSLQGILERAQKLKPLIVVVDSIQTIYSEDILSAPGSVGQIRECSAQLMYFAKKSSIPVFIIGHVTKEGAIAGPRVLEHIVDTVLYFEGEKGASFRILRAVKNRFGSTNEIGIFEMADSGLREVDNPSEIFLSEKYEEMAGSIVTASMEGTRPLLVEIQALVTPTNFGIPRRTSLGVDYNRVNMLVAIADKRLRLNMGTMDIFVNVVAGLKIDEPAVDLAVVAALVSSLKDQPIAPETFVFGEVGLAGELRSVHHCETRIKEAQRLGFINGIIPSGNAERCGKNILNFKGVKNIDEAITLLLS
jgi:DNA repair protein RadA/Sms